MAQQEMLNLSINKEMLTPVIEQQVKLLMCEILGGQDAIVNKVINQVLTTKVDESGKPTTYSGKPFYEYLLIEQVKQCVIELLKEEIASKTSTIKAQMKKYLKSDKGAGTICDALLKGWLDTIGSNYWKTNIEINVCKHDSY